MPPLRLSLTIVLIFFYTIVKAQTYWQPLSVIDSLSADSSHHVQKVAVRHIRHQIDIVDIGKLFVKDTLDKRDSSGLRPTQLHVALLPLVGYTLQTGFGAVVAANAAFLTSHDNQENVSEFLTSVTYSQYNQIIFPLQGNIWTKDNKYNIQTDWRYLRYPSYTYGLGDATNSSNAVAIDYSYVKFYQTVFRNVAENTYIGLGYDVDYFWNIHEVNTPIPIEPDFEGYGLTSTATASGPTLSLLYDSRKNSINPTNGEYAQIIYRTNLKFLGNDSTWRSLIMDLRKYIEFPYNSNNVLAFWSYDWITISGNPPYLLLPSIGWDTYWNTGRGYIQGRFKGRDMAYFESEYRFRILSNGFLGGVVFANAQSFSVEGLNRFQNVWPGWGVGIRLKLNKFSNTNLALDYGFGLEGSGGFYVNLGEVF